MTGRNLQGYKVVYHNEGTGKEEFYNAVVHKDVEDPKIEIRGMLYGKWKRGKLKGASPRPSDLEVTASEEVKTTMVGISKDKNKTE